MQRSTLLPAADSTHADQDWGVLTWFASAALGNSDTMTVGRCVIKPGCGNPLHHHPNCAEVLVLVQGRIAHTVEGGAEVEMGPGDTLTVPARVPHRARNIGSEDAVMFIAFDSAHRQFQLDEEAQGNG
ncbi:MAG TPA: cupin domain-containing protein [Armatimonadaceae bacterium]|jgi:mannose-6-phosphate isomerase-like protein (cupin superfamily)|nr:cupin domain-containing protein [Armatimonadaceae bacterium]